MLTLKSELIAGVVAFILTTTTTGYGQEENNTKYVSWQCENELKNNQTANFEESKYPLSAQSATNARIMDECLPAGSATPLGYNATMPPSLYRLLENKGCFEGIEKEDINKITAYDIMGMGCWSGFNR